MAASNDNPLHLIQAQFFAPAIVEPRCARGGGSPLRRPFRASRRSSDRPWAQSRGNCGCRAWWQCRPPPRSRWPVRASPADSRQREWPALCRVTVVRRSFS